jgi:PKD repeat protein
MITVKKPDKFMRTHIFTFLTLSLLSSTFVMSLKAQCNFQAPSGPVCASEAVRFTVDNPGENAYSWDFNDDGEIDEQGSGVDYKFPALPIDKTYNVKLFRDNVLCQTKAITILATPDPSIGVPATGDLELDERLIRVCTGVPDATISLYNNSQTTGINQSYTIDWGDGSPVETFDNSNFNAASLISHTYRGFGFYTVELTVEGGGVCGNSELYQVYLGSNPSVGLGTPGNTVGLCAPVTLTFPITGTENNPSGTTYDIFINGEQVAAFTQQNIPPYYTHTFSESSCGETTSTGNYQNAFDLQIIATNPCGTSTATVEPIEVSEPPEPMFVILDSMACTGRGIIFENASEINEVVSGSPSRCRNALTASWAIEPGEPGEDWILLDGNLFNSESIEIDFQEAGTYQVMITINSPSCGTQSFSQSISISGSPRDAGATANMDTQGSCAPGTVSFFDDSGGDNLSYQWTIEPADGWTFVNGTDAQSANPEVEIERGGSFNFAMVASNVCGEDTWDTTIVLKGRPDINLRPPPDACQSAEYDFDESLVTYDEQGNPILEYFWEFPGAIVSESYEAFPQGVRYEEVGVYAYRVSATNKCGTSVAEDTLRIINPEPVKMPSDRQFCVGDDPVLLEASPRGGIWAGPGISADGRFRPAAAGVGSHRIDYRYGEGLCMVEDVMTVEVLPSPTVDAGPDFSICQSDGPVDLSSGSPGGGTWSGPGSLVVGGRFYPARASAGSFQITYTYEDEQGCQAADVLEASVLKAPKVTVSDMTFCEGSGAVTLPDGEPAGGTWEGPGVAGKMFDPHAAGGVGTYSLTYRYTDSEGCSNTATGRVKVLGPSFVEAGPDQTMCAGDEPVDLNAGVSPPGGRWRSSGGGLTGSFFDPSKVAPGTHTLTYMVATGDCDLSDQITIDVLPTPDIDFGGTPTFICGSESEVTLTAVPEGGRWVAGPGAVFSEGVFNVAASGPGAYSFEYIYSAGGCEVRKELSITVGDTPEVSARDTVYCDGPDRLPLPPASPSGGRWSGPGVEEGHFYPERAGGVGFYTLQYEYVNGGCVAQTTAQVEVVPTATVDAGPDSSVCLSDGTVELSGFSPEGGRWLGPGIIDGRLGAFDPVEAGGGEHQLVYSVGNSGCVIRDTMKIEVLEPLDVSAGPLLDFCPGDDARALTGASPSGGTWSGPGVTGGLFDPGLVDQGEHMIQYSVLDPATGCTTEAERAVVVHERPRALFQIPPAICAGDTVPFVNNSRMATAHRWDFGDGGTSSLSAPEHIYDEAGNFSVRLISTNDFGCSDTASQLLQVAMPPEAAFELDNDRGCGPLPVSFQNRSAGDEASFIWDFGNGEQSRNPSPGTVNFAPGTVDTSYIITLIVQNRCAADIFQDTVRVLPQPIADFGAPVDTSCSPIMVVFANRSLGNATSFQWDLGNGKMSADSIPPPQTYLTDTTVSVYTIQLIAGNRCGQDTTSRQIAVKPVDVNAFFNIPAQEGCAPYEVQFTNLATPGARVEWDFGDGNRSSEENPLYRFEEAGEYIVHQYAANGCGVDTVAQRIFVLPAPDLGFSHPGYSCIGDPIAFVNESQGAMGQWWSFGDGDSSQLRDPVHAFDQPGTYTISLAGISLQNGCPAKIQSEITVFGKPEAAFDPSLSDGCAPLTVQFENYSPQEGYYYEWNFGDGNTATADHPYHTYQEAGTYQVRLTVTDANGCSQDTSMHRIMVHPAPVAAFDVDQEIVCSYPPEVRLTNRSSDASGFYWDFGDGQVSTLNQPGNHMYADTGTYDIRLIATSKFQCVDTTMRSVEIVRLPEVQYELSDRRGCAPLEVRFSNLSGANHMYWDFGDGGGSIQPSTTYTYTQAGTYQVKLVTSYQGACLDTLLLDAEVEVLPAPDAKFDFEPDPDGPPGSIVLVNQSENATKFYWEFADGTTSEEVNPRYRFFTNEPEQVYLEASNLYGCTDDALISIDPPLIKGLFVPNAFSPEVGIGEVRLFKPKGAGLKEYHIRVYSPYGQLVWESAALADGQPAESWDGTMNGRLLPQDVYVWKASAIFRDGTSWKGMADGDGNFKTIGSVTLLR